MNWNRALVGIAVGVILGLVASIYVYQQFKRAAATKTAVGAQVVVAARDLPLGTRLQPQHLRSINWPAGDPLPGMFSRIEDCLNRALMVAVVANEPILESRLAPKEGGAGLAAIIPEGMRAVSVPVNDVVGVAGFVAPGTMVDVLVTGSVEGRGGSVTRTILENVRVLAAGQKIEQDKEGKPQSVPVITLLVNPEEANKLTMGSTQGKIQLALRNTLDSKKVDPPAVLQAGLFGGAAPVPAQPSRPRVRKEPSGPTPAPPYAVEVIRGNKREVDNFPNP